MVTAKHPHQAGKPKISLVYHPKSQMKPSEKSFLLLERIKELDKDFLSEDKKLRKLAKVLRKKLGKSSE